MDYTWKGFLIDALTITAFLLITLIPWWVAKRRGDPHAASVLIIALMSGWTFIGWVLALSFAVRGNNWSTPEEIEASKRNKGLSIKERWKNATKNKASTEETKGE